jgi:hypothetical protein
MIFMILNAHGYRKCQARTSRLVFATEFPGFRVKHRFLERGL